MKSAKLAPLVSLLAILASPAMAQEGDVAKGEKTFKKCKACHMVGDGAKNRSGPVLNGIVGSGAGLNPDFKYSSAMKKASADGLVWDQANLAAFLTKPKAFMKGTKMSFSGFKKESDIANVLAYMATFQ